MLRPRDVSDGVERSVLGIAIVWSVVGRLGASITEENEFSTPFN